MLQHSTTELLLEACAVHITLKSTMKIVADFPLSTDGLEA